MSNKFKVKQPNNGQVGMRPPGVTGEMPGMPNLAGVDINAFVSFHCPDCGADLMRHVYALREIPGVLTGKSHPTLLQAVVGFECVSCGWRGTLKEMVKKNPGEQKQLPEEEAMTEVLDHKGELDDMVSKVEARKCPNCNGMLTEIDQETERCLRCGRIYAVEG